MYFMYYERVVINRSIILIYQMIYSYIYFNFCSHIALTIQTESKHRFVTQLVKIMKVDNANTSLVRRADFDGVYIDSLFWVSCILTSLLTRLHAVSGTFLKYILLYFLNCNHFVIVRVYKYDH